MTLEGLLGSHKPFIAEIQACAPHPGQKALRRAPARAARAAARSSRRHVNCAKVQDPYSLRCMPQVHGAARDGLAFARRILEVEVNSATDNPLVFADDGARSSPAATSTASRSRWRSTWWRWRSPSCRRSASGAWSSW